MTRKRAIPKEQAIKIHKKWCKILKQTTERRRSGDKDACLEFISQMTDHEKELHQAGWRIKPEDYQGKLDARCGIIPLSEPLSPWEAKFRKSVQLQEKARKAQKKGNIEEYQRCIIESERTMYGDEWAKKFEDIFYGSKKKPKKRPV